MKREREKAEKWAKQCSQKYFLSVKKLKKGQKWISRAHSIFTGKNTHVVYPKKI